MSRIGKQPIDVPEKTNVEIDGHKVTISGPLGEMVLKLPEGFKVDLDRSAMTLVPQANPTARTKALWGLWRSLLANAVVGVTSGFRKELEVVGVGYRGQKKGDRLELQLGYSHKVEYVLPAGVQVEMDGQKITVEGIDKQLVGQVAAEIRKLRPPDPYKGKGIRYVGEVLHLKPGKAAKVAGAEL